MTTYSGRELAREVRLRDMTPELLRRVINDVDDLAAVDDTRSYTALHWAASHGFLEIAQILLDAGADPLQQGGKDKNNAVILAGEGGHVNILEEFARRGVPFDGRNAHGCTAAHQAALYDRADALHVLITQCPDLLSAVNNNGMDLTRMAEPKSNVQTRRMLQLLMLTYQPDRVLQGKRAVAVRKFRPMQARP